MVLIDYVPCNTKLELLKYEREYIEKYDLVLNTIIPTRNDKEYYQDNKEEVNEKNKEYYKNNKEKVKKYKKDNKEKIKQDNKNYYFHNKEKRQEKVNCDICNKLTMKITLKRHKQTKKCLSHIKSV